LIVSPYVPVVLVELGAAAVESAMVGAGAGEVAALPVLIAAPVVSLIAAEAESLP
jgi:hypothetical protein